jgi:hypothetical protein
MAMVRVRECVGSEVGGVLGLRGRRKRRKENKP